MSADTKVHAPARSRPERSRVLAGVSDRMHYRALPTRTERGYIVTVLSGALDVACASALREQLLHLLRPATSRLVIDLSLVGHADAAGLAVLVGTGRRARLLGGSLRLAGLTPAVAKALGAVGLDRQLEVFPTVRSAVSCPAHA